MDEHARIRKAVALAFRACRKENCSHRRCLSNADRGDVGLDVLHRVVDGQTGSNGATGRVDVDGDVFFGVLRFEEEELGDDQVGNVIVDRLAEEDDVVLQEARVNVVGSLAARGLLHDHGDEHHWLESPSGYLTTDELCSFPAGFTASWLLRATPTPARGPAPSSRAALRSRLRA